MVDNAPQVVKVLSHYADRDEDGKPVNLTRVEVYFDLAKVYTIPVYSENENADEVRHRAKTFIYGAAYVWEKVYGRSMPTIWYVDAYPTEQTI